MAATLHPVKVVGLWNGHGYNLPVGGAGFWTKNEDRQIVQTLELSFTRSKTQMKKKKLSTFLSFF